MRYTTSTQNPWETPSFPLTPCSNVTPVTSEEVSCNGGSSELTWECVKGFRIWFGISKHEKPAELP